MNVFLTILILGFLSNGIYSERVSEIDTMLKVLNKPAIKTIESEDGDIIDCVDIYKQPAFDHPDLKNHKIQMEPSVNPLASKQPAGSQKTSSSKPIFSQIWRKTGDCPEATIPIRRVRREELNRTSSALRFGRKPPHTDRFMDRAHQKSANFRSLRSASPENRAEAVVVSEIGNEYIGAQADLNVWNPKVESGDYSSMQIWLLGGLMEYVESVEAGWMVNPGIFSDSLTRFFVYWTKDAYKTTGCFNLLCSGFVQTNTKFALGGAIDHISTRGGDQYHITVGIFRDPLANWWLNFAGEVVGYWPTNLFLYLNHSALAAQWGGEVYSPNVRKSPHTKTGMGSGDWAFNQWQNACFATNVRFMNYSWRLMFPEQSTLYQDESNCYTTDEYRESSKSEPFYYFGGPGQNAKCP